MKRLVSVSEFRPGVDERLQWDFALPPSLDQDRIQIHLPLLRTAHRLGGIAHSLVYDYQGDLSIFTPAVAGINPDGSAVATKAGVAKKAEPTTTRITDLDPTIYPHYGKAEARHGINKAEIASRVSDRVGRGQTPEKAWAKELDKALRVSLRQAGSEHLLIHNLELGHLSETMDYLWHLGLAGALAPDLANGHLGFGSKLIISFYGAILAVESLDNKNRHGSTLLKQRRWSMGPISYQLDRYLIMSGLTRVPGLIQARD
ncbi:MAG TPA: hypothetical protein VLG37_00815 [Candidatus Saccharimonadales bacterium]|nr:hypothetical protein [Candidatus Saccharimonadales bacterium]